MSVSLIPKIKDIGWEGSRRSALVRIALLSAMVPLLILIAALQYRAASQLSAATQVRIGSNLQSLMTQWHLDFYGEMSTICVALQIGPDSGAGDEWSDYLHRYRD